MYHKIGNEFTYHFARRASFSFMRLPSLTISNNQESLYKSICKTVHLTNQQTGQSRCPLSKLRGWSQYSSSVLPMPNSYDSSVCILPCTILLCRFFTSKSFMDLSDKTSCIGLSFLIKQHRMANIISLVIKQCSLKKSSFLTIHTS